MTMGTTWPQYLETRAAEPPPNGCHVVAGSTPVVSFGHPLKPEVATLGINPSSSEFLDRQRRLLRNGRRRLATLESIGADDYRAITRVQAAQIIADCASYFERRPYAWFNALDTILADALGVSYFIASAAHLDLVQWATDPVWQGLPQVARARLLSADRGFLIDQLGHEGYRLIVVAGRTAMSWVEKTGLVKWRAVDRLDGAPSATFFVGDTVAPRFVGWSCNLQSQPGARRHMDALTRLLTVHAEQGGGTYTVAQDESLEKGTHFRTRDEFVAALRRWLETTDEETIGDTERFARAPWISFESSAGIVDLNADTNRRAVERMLGHSAADVSWHVIENRRGKINKVAFDLNDTHEGWYAYLRQPLDAPQEI
jgi:hypothetical protein